MSFHKTVIDLLRRASRRLGRRPNLYIEKVEIVIDGSNDPSRVARLTLEALQKLHGKPS